MNIDQPETAPVLTASIPSHAQRYRYRLRCCFHVLRANGFQSACGLLMRGGAHPYPAEEVSKWERCQRPGCKERWPTPVGE